MVSAAGFDRWWRDQPPDLLTYTRDVLVRSPDAVDEQAWPSTWRQGELTLDLDYRFEPGAADDGVTVVVPLQQLGAVRPDRFEWLVPGLREELVTTLIRGLPKDLRRRLVPVPETAARALGRLEPRRRPLAEDLSRAIDAFSIPPEAWDFSSLPPHLRVTFRVVDSKRGVLASGKSLSDVRAQVRPLLRAELTAASSKLERTGLTAWDVGSLPREVTLRGTGQAVRAYPALVDEGASVGVKVLETPGAQAASMWAGTRRLLLLSTPSVSKYVHDRLSNADRLALSAAPHGSLAAVLDDAVVAAADALMASGGGPGVGRGGLRAAARPRGGRARVAYRGGRRLGGRGARRRPRGVAPVRALDRRALCSPPAPTSASSSPASSTPGSSPPPGSTAWPTSSATSGPPPGGWSGCRTRWRSTATA